MESWVTLAEAAPKFGIKPDTLKKMCGSGRVPREGCMKVSNMWRVRLSILELMFRQEETLSNPTYDITCHAVTCEKNLDMACKKSAGERADLVIRDDGVCLHFKRRAHKPQK